MFWKINITQENLFIITVRIIWLLIILTVLGISQSAPKYLGIFEYYVKIYVCLFLIWRFNPFNHSNTFTVLDKRIAFSSGIIILTTTFLTTFLQKIYDRAGIHNPLQSTVSSNMPSTMASTMESIVASTMA